MVDRNLLREFDVSDDELTAVVTGEDGPNELRPVPRREGQNFEIGGIVSGKVIEIVGDQVVVDVGYKSEGPRPAQRVGRRAAAAARRRRRGPARRHGGRDRRDRPLPQEGPPDARLGDGDLQVPRGRRGQGQGHPQDQGRPARRHRRQRLPARQPGRHPPPVRHRRLHRSRDRVHDPQDRRGPAQHRRQPPQAHRDHPRAAEEAAPRRDRARPGPHRHGQEHRRLRRVRRPRRHRRPAAHHRHELGPDQPPQRHGQDRRPDRGHGPPRRQGPREDRAGPQAEDAPARGRTSPTSTRSAPASWARSST